MSSVDQRIVEMRFDNKQFESGVSTTLSTLDKLKQALKLSDAGKGLDDLSSKADKFQLNGIQTAVETVSDRFSTLGIIGMTALQNITNKAIDAGERIAKALTLDPVTTGFNEYELKMDSIKTMLANTNGKNSLEEIKDVLEGLNKYADDTIYNFGQMTSAMGKMTAQGIDLYDAEEAVRGLSNLAALVGSGSQEYTNAMNYGLTQALAMGELRLQDWKSFENANISSKVFRDELIKTAQDLGYFGREWEDNTGHAITGVNLLEEASEHFRETLKYGWVDNDVLLTTLSKFADTTTELGKKAQDAAREVRTVTKLKDALLESLQSGWANTWELIIGDVNEATEVLTKISDALSSIFNKAADERNEAFKRWHDNPIDGRSTFITAFEKIWDYFTKILNVFDIAKKEIFGNDALFNILTNITHWLDDFAYSLDWTSEKGYTLHNIFAGAMSIIDMVLQAASAVWRTINPIFEPIKTALGVIFNILGRIGNAIINFNKKAKINDTYYKTLQNVLGVIKKLLSPLTSAIKAWKSLAKFMGFSDRAGRALKTIFDNLIKALKDAKGRVDAFIKSFKGSSLFKSFTGQVDKLTKKITVLGADAIVGLLNWLEDLAKKEIKLPEFSYESFISSIKDIKEKVTNTFDSIKSVITGKVSSLEEAFPGISENPIYKSITSFVDSAKEKFKELTGIEIKLPTFEDFKNKIEEIKTNIKEAIDTIKGKIEEFLGIEINLPTLEDVKAKYNEFKTSVTEALKSAGDAILNFLGIANNTDPTGTIQYFEENTSIFKTIKDSISEVIGKIEELTGIDIKMPSFKDLITLFTTLKGKVSKAKTAIEEFIGIDFKMPTLETFTSGLSGLKDVATKVSTALKNVKKKITDFLSIFKKDKANESDETGTIEYMQTSAEKLQGITDKFATAIETIKKAFGTLKTWFSNGLTRIKEGFESFWGKEFNLPNLLGVLLHIAQVLKTLAMGKFLWNLSGFLDSISRKFLDKQTIIGKIIDALKGLGQTVLMVAGAIALLVGAVAIASQLNYQDLYKGIATITALAAVIALFIGATNNFQTNNALKTALVITALATSLGLLTGAILALSFFSPERFKDGILKLSGSLLAISVAAVLAKTTLGYGATGTASTILALAVSLSAVTAAIFALSLMNVDQFKSGLLRVAGALATIAGAAILAKTTLGAGGLGTAGVILALSAALIGMAIALNMFKDIDMITLSKGLGSMVISIVALAAVSTALSGIAIPMLLVAAAVGALGLSLISLKYGLDAAHEIASNIGSTMNTIAQKIGEGIDAIAPKLKIVASTLLHNLWTFVKNEFLIKGPQEIANMLADFIEFVFDGLPLPDWIGTKIGDGIRNSATWITDHFEPGEYKSIGEALSNSIADGVNESSSVVTDAVETVNDSLPELTLKADYTQLAGLAEQLNIPLSEVISKVEANGQDYAYSWLQSLSNGLADTSSVETAANGVASSIVNGANFESIESIFANAGITIPEGFTGSIESMLGSVLGSGQNINSEFLSGFDLSGLETVLNNAGTSLPTGFNENINSMLSQVFGTSQGMHNEVLNGFNGDALVSDIEYFGTSSGDKLASGMKSKSSEAYNAGVELSNEANSGLSTGSSNAEVTGLNTGQGFINGIRNKLTELKNAALSFGTTAITYLSNAVQTNSPSKLTTKIGGYFGEGFVNGINSFLGKVMSTSDNMGKKAVDSLANPVKLINDVLSMDIDATPTIAPVMDLTNIDSGINEINSLADRTNLLFGSATVANVKGVSSISSNPVQTSIDGLRGDIGSLNSTLRSSMSGENMNLLNDMVTLMNQYFPEFASREVVLDSGEMVGAMTPRINKELRNIYNRSR